MSILQREEQLQMRKSVDNQYGQGIAQPQFFQNISPNFEQYDSGDRGQQ